MAVDAFMWFVSPQGDITEIKGETIDKYIASKAEGLEAAKPPANSIFNIKDYSFDIDNLSTLSSQSGGAGGGKCNMNPLTVNKAVDTASPKLFQACAIGTHIKEAYIVLRKAGGTSSGLKPYLRFAFKAVFITGVTWAISGDEPITETINLMYGALRIDYWKQKSDGTLLGEAITAQWNQVNNVRDDNPIMNDG